jgi:hypothetical protein
LSKLVNAVGLLWRFAPSIRFTLLQKQGTSIGPICALQYPMPQPLPIVVFALASSVASVPVAARNAYPGSTPPAQQGTPPLEPPVPAAGDPLYAPVVTTRGPQSLHDRFMDYLIVTIGPRALFVPPVYASIRMADPPAAYTRDWRLGAGAFGRNYGNVLAARTSLETGRFLTAALLHEDFRYRPSTSGNPFVRSFHALAFTFVDKSDSGHNRIAFANFVGAGAGGSVGNLYLPPGFNDLGHAETRIAFAFGGFALQNLLREFTPELLKATHRWHAPFPRIPLPEWWAKFPDR